MWDSPLLSHSPLELGTMYWLILLICGKLEDDELSKNIDTQLHWIMRLKILINKASLLNYYELIGEIYFYLSSLPLDWASVVAALEQPENCTLNLVIQNLRNTIMKRSPADKLLGVAANSGKRSHH